MQVNNNFFRAKKPFERLKDNNDSSFHIIRPFAYSEIITNSSVKRRKSDFKKKFCKIIIINHLNIVIFTYTHKLSRHVFSSLCYIKVNSQIEERIQAWLFIGTQIISKILYVVKIASILLFLIKSAKSNFSSSSFHAIIIL